MVTSKDEFTMPRYKANLIEKFWEYGRTEFGLCDDYFDRPLASKDRPPIFKREQASRNVLLKDAILKPVSTEVLNAIPEGKRHKWFGSMASSQALTQSVFGNLIAHGKLDCLRALMGDDAKPLFIRDSEHTSKCQLEVEVDYMGEKSRGRTSLDVLFNGNHRIAVECKLTEPEVRSCSRPRLRPSDPSYGEQFCDGRYAVQLRRRLRCSLSEIGVRYWSYIPDLFDWSAEIDHDPCPLTSTYQLVRNLLAVCVDPTGGVRPDSGHVVMLYDERNPAFQGEGKGITAWNKVRAGLKKQSLMQKCTWQEIVTCLRADDTLDWLATGLSRKYGF